MRSADAVRDDGPGLAAEGRRSHPGGDYRLRVQDAPAGAQVLLVAFGALVLVPLLTGLPPSVALFTAGAGTLLFQVVTGGRVPVFLGSSFAFIAPITYGVATWGVRATLSGLVAAGLVYVVLAGLVAVSGPRVLDRVLPPIVVGPVIMTIGLILAPVAVNMALGRSGDGKVALVPESAALIVSLTSLLATVGAALIGRGLAKLLPVLIGVTTGYGLSLLLGLVSLEAVATAPWVAVPEFTTPVLHWEAILFLVPVAIAPAIEHVGDILAIGRVTGRNYVDRPGLHRTLLGDGLATSLASYCGGPPNTTYSEVTGVVALTRMANPAIMTWASAAAILLAFVGKLGALLQTVPAPVVGGITILLFGAITVIGLDTLLRARLALLTPRNLALVSVVLVTGIGGMSVPLGGGMRLGGVGLAGILAVILNLVLPGSGARSEPASSLETQDPTPAR